MNTPWKRHAPLVLALLALLAALLYALEDVEALEPAPVSAPPRPPVEVRAMHPGPVQVRLRGLARVRPTAELRLTAPRTSVLRWVSDQLRVGLRVKKGQRLLALDRTAAGAELDEARATLARAELHLAEAEADARLQTTHPPPVELSPLARKTPQLALARRERDAAASRLRLARLELKQHHLYAPFDALVVAASAQVGQRVEPGQPLAELYGTERAQIALPFSADERPLLPDEAEGARVLIYRLDGRPLGGGRLQRLSQHEDAENGHRLAYVEVEAPLERSPPLLFGALVELSIAGRTTERALRIPESALDPQHHLWTVDGQDTLRRHLVEPIAYEAGGVVIAAPGPGPVQVALHPRSSFVDGTKVAPYRPELPR